MRRVPLAALFVAAVGLAALSEADLPHSRPGMWEVTHSGGGGPAKTERNCVTPEKDARGRELSRQMCPSQSFSRVPGGFAVDADCAKGPVTVKMHTVITGDFNSHVVVDSEGSMSVGGQAHPIKSHTESRWVGPC